jgi:hypothetical protein
MGTGEGSILEGDGKGSNRYTKNFIFFFLTRI